MCHLHLGSAWDSTGGKEQGALGAGTPAGPAPLTHLQPRRALPELTGASASAHLAASVRAPRPETPATTAPRRAPPPRRCRSHLHRLAGCSGPGAGRAGLEASSCRPLPGALAPPLPPRPARRSAATPHPASRARPAVFRRVPCLSSPSASVSAAWLSASLFLPHFCIFRSVPKPVCFLFLSISSCLPIYLISPSFLFPFRYPSLTSVFVLLSP